MSFPRMRRFPSLGLGSFGRSLLAGGLVLGVLLHGPASTAHAANAVDLKLNVSLDRSSANTGADVVIEAYASHTGAATSGARVDLLLSQQFSNVKVKSSGGFTCAITPDTFFNSSVWRVKCTKGSIAPGGQWFDLLQISASAPNTAGNYGIDGVIVPIDATETNDGDNRSSAKLEVVQKIVPKPSRNTCILINTCK